MEHARPAQLEDMERIAVLAAAMHDELAPMKGGSLWAAREARAAPYGTTYTSLLDQPDTCFLVGCIDDVVVGFGAVEIESLRTGERLGVITDLFVEVDARSVAVGETITNALVAFCVDQGCIGVDARALPGHRATKNFFEDQGFTARALVMHHRLSDSNP